MNTRDLRVVRYLLDRPDEWVSSETLAYRCNMTYRQSKMMIMRLGLCLERVETADSNGSIRLVTDGHDMDEVRYEVLAECHGIRDGDRDRVMSALTPVGWLSAYDISMDTGISPVAVSLMLDDSEDVESCRGRKEKLYRDRSMDEHVFHGA